MDDFILTIPGALINALNLWIFVQINPVDAMFDQLTLIGHESVADLKVWFLQNWSIWVYAFLLVFGIYRTETKLAFKHSFGMNIIGHFIAYIGLVVIVVNYLRYINDPDNKNPYDKDFFELEDGNVTRKQHITEALLEKLEYNSMDGDLTGRNCKSGVSGHMEMMEESGHHSISAITTSAMQIKRAIKVYQDRLGDDEN